MKISEILLRRSRKNASAEDFELVESQFGIRIPTDIRDFLTVKNGGIPEGKISFSTSGAKLYISKFVPLLPPKLGEGIANLLSEMLFDFGRCDYLIVAMDNEFTWIGASLRSENYGAIFRLTNYQEHFEDEAGLKMEKLSNSFNEFISQLILE